MSKTDTDWDRAEQAVAAGTAVLQAAATHRDIRAWAREEKVATKTLWPKVKVEMRKQLDIDYDLCRSPGYRTWREIRLSDLIQKPASE